MEEDEKQRYVIEFVGQVCSAEVGEVKVSPKPDGLPNSHICDSRSKIKYRVWTTSHILHVTITRLP